jgi:glycosyltransferase involved in cell wall biosynthesis
MKKTTIKKNKIFVQIAAYRDPELIPTLKSLLENAKSPENLTICIANQWDDEHALDEYRKDKRFKIIDIPHLESKGTCWARNLIQQKYDGEEYTLQLDSHHRFIENWDQELINMVKQLKKKGHKKPLLTAYISSFDPENDPSARVEIPWWMTFDRFIPEGAVFFLPASIEDYKERTEPIPARFYSAHFCFTLGQFCKEVPHDPEYYFHGEEISIAVRAFTNGYDLFHPHKVIAWHEYTRKGRPKQWDDDKEWGDRNQKCHAKNRKLFGMDGEEAAKDFGVYGFGKKRTLEDYERYAGVSFKKRAVQQYTLDHKLPPNPKIEDPVEYENSFLKIFRHCIDIGYDKVPEKDYDFWVVAFHDDKDETMYRKDADSSEIQNFYNDPDGYCKVWREFQTDKRPCYWVVWPHSVSKGWGERIVGYL